MRRSFAMVAGLLMTLLVVVEAPPAHAFGAGVCVIGGTINFVPVAHEPGTGAWNISPATIQCRGQYNTKELMLRNGSFTGDGSYTSVPNTDNGCLRQLGTGSVDYWITTQKQDVHIKEPNAFLAGGAGAFMTPTLRGVFQILSYEGDCLASTVTRASFLAEVTLLRESSSDYTP
jgi:hypothetical protein